MKYLNLHGLNTFQQKFKEDIKHSITKEDVGLGNVSNVPDGENTPPI